MRSSSIMIHRSPLCVCLNSSDRVSPASSSLYRHSLVPLLRASPSNAGRSIIDILLCVYRFVKPSAIHCCSSHRDFAGRHRPRWLMMIICSPALVRCLPVRDCWTRWFFCQVFWYIFLNYKLKHFMNSFDLMKAIFPKKKKHFPSNPPWTSNVLR